MALSHIIALPAQELSVLLCAATAPQFAQLFEQLPSFRAALLAPARPALKPHGNTVCPCCTGRRIVSVYSKACNYNWFDIPYLGFETKGYMPSNMGIPGDGDGPDIEVCLDCGRVVNGEYPLPDDVLQQRVVKYKEECL